MKTKGSGSVSGILIGGEPHSITGGNGQCYLAKCVQDVDGAPSQERIDLRKLRKIETDQWGEIRISRKKIPFTLPRRLDECIEFLDSVPDQTIRLFSYDRMPTLRQILDEMIEGFGGDDFAIEEICRRGAETRAELLSALNNQSLRKYRAAIIQLLLLCYPSDPTRMAIEHSSKSSPRKIARNT